MKIALTAGIITVACAGVLIASATHAEAEQQITQEKVALIREQCLENLATLNRLHQTDAFLRNDRGNLYRTISDKLMVPLNRRLASNQLDGGDLLTITADFNKQYTKFFDAYIVYDEALSKVLDIDCTKQPVAFYDALVDARRKRTELSSVNTELLRIIVRYGASFEDFKAEFLKESRNE